MADNLNGYNPGCFKEAVCIDAYRVYDSCSERDCLEDLPVYFGADDQLLVDAATSVKIRDVEVISVYLDLEALPFNKGCYSVDLNFYFNVTVSLYNSTTDETNEVTGLSVFCKKLILYGGEGSVKSFSSDLNQNGTSVQNASSSNVPRAVAEISQPIALAASLSSTACSEPTCAIPEAIQSLFDDLVIGTGDKCVLATFGIFTIVQIERNVQMLIPAYDFCIPNKESCYFTNEPCDFFSNIDFPMQEFFPPKLNNNCYNENNNCNNGET